MKKYLALFTIITLVGCFDLSNCVDIGMTMEEVKQECGRPPRATLGEKYSIFIWEDTSLF